MGEGGGVVTENLCMLFIVSVGFNLFCVCFDLVPLYNEDFFFPTDCIAVFILTVKTTFEQLC